MKNVMKKFTDINLAVNNLVAAANADYTDRPSGMVLLVHIEIK